MQEPALYFPYIHIRDDGWLKAAALYWPSIHRLRPRPHRIRDSPTAAIFREAGVLRDANPAGLLDTFAWDLLESLNRNGDALVEEFSIVRARADHEGDRFGDSGPDDPALGWIHARKFPSGLVEELEMRGLAQYGRTMGKGAHGGADVRHWVGLHPALAGAYMTALAGHLSRHIGYATVTDQPDLRRATVTSSVDTALRLLCAPEEVRQNPDDTAGARDYYVMLALQAVRPRNLDAASPEAILKCRTELAGPLQTFRDYVRSQQEELAQLAGMPSEHHRLEAFQEHVRQTIEVPLTALEQGLSMLRLEPTRTLLMTTSFVPPVGLGTLTGTNPALTAGVGVAAAVGGAWWGNTVDRRKAREESPVGFLLDARDRLTPKTVVSQARKLYRGYA